MYVCLSEAKVSHSHEMWTEVSSSIPHFLQVGLLLSPITYRCLLNRGSVRSTRGLGPTMTARGQSIGISIGMLPQTLIMSRPDQLS